MNTQQLVTNHKHFNVNVMVDTVFVMEQFKPIVLMMEAAISNADTNAYRDFDADGAYMRLFEAMDHYLAFLLGRQRANIGFDYYVNEYFMAHARFLNNPDFLRTGGVLFANAAGYLQRALLFAQSNIEQNGATVGEVHSVPYSGYALFTYLVTGYYDNHLLDSDVVLDTAVATFHQSVADDAIERIRSGQLSVPSLL